MKPLMIPGPDYDTRCSNICTRAGLAALTLCTIAFAMLPALDKGRALEALAQYVSMRLSMEEDFKRLDSDPAWKDLAGGPSYRQASTDWNLDRLLEYKTDLIIPLTPLPPQPSKAPPSGSLPLGQETLEVRNPRLRLQVRIEPLHRISDSLEEISKGDLLTRARKYSSLYDRSIRRWAMLRDDWINKAIAKDGPGIYVPPRDVPDQTRRFRRETILKYLNLPQVRELTSYELPSAAELERLSREQTGITLPVLGFPIGLASATLIVEIGILLITLYFLLYYREARLSNNFPAPATLFGVVARTRLFQVVFWTLLSVPVFASVALAWRSYWTMPLNALLALPILCVEVMIVREACVQRGMKVRMATRGAQ